MSSSDDDQLFVIEKILDSKKIFDAKVGKIDSFRVKWKGYDTDESTWEPADNFGPEGQTMITNYKLQRKMKRMTKKRSTSKSTKTDLMQRSVSQLEKEISKTRKFEEKLIKRAAKLDAKLSPKIKEEPSWPSDQSCEPDTDDTIDWKKMVLNTNAKLVLEKVKIPKDLVRPEKKTRPEKSLPRKKKDKAPKAATEFDLFGDPINLTSKTKSAKKKDSGAPKDITNGNRQTSKRSTDTPKRSKDSNKRSKEIVKSKEEKKASTSKPKQTPEAKKSQKRKSEDQADATLKKPKLDGIKFHKKSKPQKKLPDSATPSRVISYSDARAAFHDESFEAYTVHQATDDDDF